jgi:hypothetical protein
MFFLMAFKYVPQLKNSHVCDRTSPPGSWQDLGTEERKSFLYLALVRNDKVRCIAQNRRSE